MRCFTFFHTGPIIAIEGYHNKKHRGGSMLATIIPDAVILTNAQKATVSVMTKGCIVV